MPAHTQARDSTAHEAEQALLEVKAITTAAGRPGVVGDACTDTQPNEQMNE
jgi:hypothetical protein